jgi:ketosteroid isomerase-like protein
MHKAVSLAIAMVAVLGVSGCTKKAEAAADTAQISGAIKAQEAQWEKDYAAKDINALASHYADDSELGGPGDALATNDIDRRKALQAMVTDPNFKLSFATDRVLVAQSGDYAYSRGHYSLTLTDKATSKAADSQGSYLTVYKKQDDGSWKAVEDFITPGPGSAAATK